MTLRPGAELWSLDIKLAAAPVRRIRGRILDDHGNPVAKAAVVLGKGFGPSFTQETRGDGTFEFSSVVDDEWRLSAVAEKGGVKQKGTQSIEVKGHDLENVELRLAAPFTLRREMVIEVSEGTTAPPPAPPIDLLLESGQNLLSDGVDSFLPVRSREAGDFTAAGVYPGPYQIQSLSDSPAPYYLDSIRLDEQDALGMVSILSDAQRLTITYKLGGGTVRGTIEGCNANHVFRVPQDPRCGAAASCAQPIVVGTANSSSPLFVPGSITGSPRHGIRVLLRFYRRRVCCKQTARVTVRANESTSADIRMARRR